MSFQTAEALSDARGCREQVMKAEAGALASQHKEARVPSCSQCERGERDAPGPCCASTGVWRGEEEVGADESS